MDDIFDRKAKIWCDRLNGLMKKKGYTQELFLKEYRSRYGKGTQANVSRWLRVGNIIQKDGSTARIGFPSYESMANIANIFGVTVGYLTGETDCETFEMEQVSRFIGVDEETCKAIQKIASGQHSHYLMSAEANQYRTVLRRLFMANSFSEFVKEVVDYSWRIYRYKHPVNHLEETASCITNEETRELALQCIDYISSSEDEMFDDFSANNVAPTKEQLDAIAKLDEAIWQDCNERRETEQQVKLSEYNLQKIYFRLIEEITTDKHFNKIWAFDESKYESF